jgi:Tol biopolymer transport system component
MKRILTTLFFLCLVAGCTAPGDSPEPSATIALISAIPELPETITLPPATPEPTPSPAFQPEASQGQILFSVYPHGEIGLINADGSNQTILLDQPTNQGIYDDRFATWIPDGSGISYTIDNFTQAEIWVMDPDGGNPHLLIEDVLTLSSHTWSPDGQRLAFVARDHQIKIYHLAEGITSPLTDGRFLSEAEPDWSPDGTQIVFSARIAGNQDIYLINTDGTGLTRVTSHPHNDQHPDWAPDNHTIAFSSTRDGDDVKDIFTINLQNGTEEEGNTPHQLTFSGMLEIDPDWSPDGSLIVYCAHQFGAVHAMLFITDAAGENHFQLTEQSIYHSPIWLP